MSGEGKHTGADLAASISALFGNLRGDIVQILGRIVHAANLAGRAFRDIEEAREIGTAHAFESLGDIVHDRNGRSLHLVAESKIAPGRALLAKVAIDIRNEQSGLLPDVQVLKLLHRSRSTLGRISHSAPPKRESR